MDPSFWAELGRLKLDTLQLSEDAQPITGQHSVYVVQCRKVKTGIPVYLQTGQGGRCLRNCACPVQASTAPTPTLSTLHHFSLMDSPSNLRRHRGRHAVNLPDCYILAACLSEAAMLALLLEANLV